MTWYSPRVCAGRGQNVGFKEKYTVLVGIDTSSQGIMPNKCENDKDKRVDYRVAAPPVSDALTEWHSFAKLWPRK